MFVDNDVLDAHIVPGLSRTARARLSMIARAFAYVAPPARTLDDKATAAEVLEWVRLEHATIPPDEVNTAAIAKVEAYMTGQTTPASWSVALDGSTPYAIPGLDWSAPSSPEFRARRGVVINISCPNPIAVESCAYSIVDITGSLHIYVHAGYVVAARCRPFAGAYPIAQNRDHFRNRDGRRRLFNPHHPGQDVADWTCVLETGVPGPTLLETLIDHL